MKTKQASMKAVFTKECNNAINHGGKMETSERFILIDKKSEKRVVEACVYVGRSRSSSQAKAALWVRLSDKKKPEGWEYGHTAGRGCSSGHYSEAIANAVESAGIELYGSAYEHQGDKVDFKRRVHFGGVGEGATRRALLAIAYAAGWTDVVFVAA